MKNQIRLDTMSDVNEFVQIACKVSGEVHLTDSRNFKVNGKSLLGVMYSLEFNEIWVESDEDFYSQIEKFIVA